MGSDGLRNLASATATDGVRDGMQICGVCLGDPVRVR